MPRKSAASIAMVEPQGRRLEPPPDLSAAENAAFVAVVGSVKPGHFAPEDIALLTAYSAAIVDERAIARELANADEKDRAGLRAAHDRRAGALVRLARALRLGAMARAPSRNRRLPGTVEPSGAMPWEYQSARQPSQGEAN